MARHAARELPPPWPPFPPQLVREDPLPVPPVENFRPVLLVVAMLCVTALLTAMALSGYAAGVGGLIAMFVILWAVCRVATALTELIRRLR